MLKGKKILAALTLFILFSLTAGATTFPVTNTNDAGTGSLRQAILNANAAGNGSNVIEFDVYGQITILSSLPTITASGLTIDGQNKITINSYSASTTNPEIDPFIINANSITIRNFTLTNNGGTDINILANTSGVSIQHIRTYSTIGNFLNAVVAVNGSSANLTIRDIVSTDVEPCNGAAPYVGKAFYFTGGIQTNLVMDSIRISTQANARGCTGIAFSDAGINGWNLTNSHISGFGNAIVLTNAGGVVDSANNILLNHVTIDSLTTGVSQGFTSNYINTGITFKNTTVDLDVVTSGDDGDYGIRFDNTTNGITLDSVLVKDVDIMGIYFSAAAQNISITHSTVNEPTTDVAGGEQDIRFNSTATSVTISNTHLDGSKNGGAKSLYGLVFVDAVTGLVLDSLTINDMTQDGIDVYGAATNFRLDHSKFTGNFDGIEFYNTAPHTNVSIQNSSFLNGGRSGILIDAAHATEQFTMTDDTVAGNASHGVWAYGGNVPTNISLNGCVIHDNGGYGVFMNTSPTNVVITQNSIYNNKTAGIGMDGSGNCGYTGVNRPILVSSTSLGGGQYQLQITIPNISGGALYNIDIYANDPGTSAASGQYYVTTLTGLPSGTSTQNITYNAGPGASGLGFWTATLRIPANTCGTSAFSNSIPIGLKGPANVNSGIVAWYRADNGANGLNWSDISGNSNHMTVVGAPNLTTGLVNFNPAFYYNGSSGHLVPAKAGVTGAYTLGGLGMLEGSQNGRIFTSSTGNKLFGWNGGLENTLYSEGWLDNGNAISNKTKLYSFKRSTTPSAAYEFKGNGGTLLTGGATDAGVWTLDVGGVAFNTYSKAYVPEVFIYNRDITPAEMQRIESYMALKYGVTLNNGSTDYLATDGTVYWTADATYKRRITGIGRDTVTLLYQKESLSSDTGIVTLALGSAVMPSNAANTATITANRSFLVFADNNGNTSFTTAITGTHATQRMARVWKVQKTNWTDQTITLQMKGGGNNNYLLIGTDAGFASFSQELQLDATGSVTLNSGLLANGAYFTLGAEIKGPANVNTGIALWLKADDGAATGAGWNDLSGNANGAVQPSAVSQASVLPAAVNFNPALKFDGTNDFMQTPSMMTPFGTNNLQIYAVSITDNIQIQSLFYEPEGNGNYVNVHLPWSDGILYWDAPWGYRASAPWGGRLGAPFLWSFLRSPAGSSANRNRTVVATLTGPLANIPGTNQPFVIGGAGYAANPFNGKIAEFIVYNNAGAITATQRQQIESYLAIKYGLTLSQAIATDYLASDGTTRMWTAANNSGYGRRITGIGRDSITALYQKQSLSADTGFVTLALGNTIAASNVANTTTITADKSFLVFSDNGGSIAYSNTVTGITGVNVIQARIWKVQKTNWTDQTITLRTDSTRTLPQFLLISADAAFGTGDIALPVINGVVTLNSSQLPNGAYFTFGNALRAPGGVTTGIAAWYRGDHGLSRGQWNDFSGYSINIPQTLAAYQPAVLPAGVNFNTAASFTPPQYFGNANVLDPASSVLGNGSINNIAVFGVSTAAAGASGGGIFDQMTTNGNPVITAPSFSNSTTYWDAPYGFRVNAPWTSSINKPNVWSFTKTLTNMSFFRDHVTVINTPGTYDFGAGNGANYSSNIGVWHGNGYFDGTIPELIVYKDITALTATDRLKIESYLALKYGISLNQATATDYLASDGTTRMWTAANNTGYSRRITGIGRDDLDSLLQKQSLSADTGIVTVAAGTIAATDTSNTATIANDRSFFVFSDNGAPTSYGTSVTGLTLVNARMNRVFKLQKTNWADQSITLKLTGATSSTYLLVSTDPTFATGITTYKFTDSTIAINTSNLADGAYFTFGTKAIAPNAVSNGLQVWLRADDGSSTGASWKDFSVNGNNAAQAAVSNQPVTDAKGLNFNYAMQFNGSNNYMDITSTRVDPDNSTVFAAASGSGYTASARDMVSSGGTGANDQGMEFRIVPNPKGNLQYLESGSAGIVAVTGNKVYVEGRTYLFSATQTNGTNGIRLFQNNGQDLQGTMNSSPATANRISIGSRTITGRALYWMGNIGEVIIYNKILNDGQRQKVESYLALKYGVTLNQFPATSYLASDSSVYWDATANATYHKRITGIGRDDSTALNTKQSLSVDTGFVTVSLGSSVAVTNQENSSLVTNDRSFFAFADDSGSLSYSVPVSGVNVTYRMARVWKAQKTNWADQDITLVAATPTKSMYLLVSNSADFAALTQELPVNADGSITLNSSLIPSGYFFTFARKQLQPGGVTGASLWIRSDIGTGNTKDSTAVHVWDDFSSMGNNAVQDTVVRQPLFRNNAALNINFNPIVKFDGRTSYMKAASEFKTTGLANAAIFAAATTDTMKAGALFGESITFSNVLEGMVPWSDGNVYWDAAYPSRISAPWAGTLTTPFLWSFTRSTTNMSVYKNAKTLISTNGSYPGLAAQGSAFSVGNQDPSVSLTFGGKIGEMIVYNDASTMTAMDRQRIHTYLGIKYGITVDQTVATDYLATDGTTKIWDAAVNATYKFGITGIGRDDLEGLTQTQSRNSDTSRLRIAIGLGAIASDNPSNTNTFAADKSYLVWGDDNAPFSFLTVLTGNPIVNYRMTRVWKTQLTGTVGSVQIAVPFNALPNATDANLVVSNDATFDGTDNFYPLSQVVMINGVKHYAATVSLTNGQYFSFATNVKAPGGVPGTTLWLRSDQGISTTGDGTPVDTWVDYGNQLNSVSQTTVANQPVLKNNRTDNINFNPVLRFNGSTSTMVGASMLKTGTYSGAAAFVVNSQVSAGNSSIFTEPCVQGDLNLHATWGDNVVYWDAPLNSNRITYAAGNINNLVNLWTGTSDITLPSGRQGIYRNGTNVATGNNTSTYTGTNSPFDIGESGGVTPAYNGRIPEMIVYTSALTPVRQQQVNTYMGIKYGITLNQGGTSYLATDSLLTIWDATTNSTHKNGITGIGRDDVEGLVQRQSRNSDTTRMSVVMGLGEIDSTNSANTNNFTADRSYLIWGDDNGSTTFQTPVSGNPAVNYRMGRTWRVQETGTVGSVEVAFPYDVLPNPVQSFLVVSNDLVFDGSDTYIPLYNITVGGKTHWAAKVDLASGQYCTVAAFIKSPGGVGLTSLWLRPDKGILNNTDGTEVDVWVDFANQVNNARQPNVLNQPVIVNNVTDNVNFNPMVKFTAANNQLMNLDVNKLPSGTNARTLIGMGKLATLPSQGYLVNWGNAAADQWSGILALSSQGVFSGFGDDVTTTANFWQANVFNEMYAGWAGNGGNAYLYSMQKQVGAPSPKNWNTGTTGGASIGATYNFQQYWNGTLGDLMVFDRELSPLERTRVESYLAIRYGYSLDQTSPNDYMNTNSTVVWNAATNSNYQHNIAGIGRDDVEGLDQRQSRSINSGAIVAIGLGTIAKDNLSNTNTFSNDTSYMVWSSNSTATTTITTNLPAGFSNSQRMAQQWRTSMSNFSNQLQPLSLQFDLSAFSYPDTGLTNLVLLIDGDGDGDFTTGMVQAINASSYDGTAKTATFSNVSSLTNGSVFTFAFRKNILRLTAKVYLQGAWNGAAMDTTLKAASMLPAADPYGLNSTPAVSPNAAPASVVDWVRVELRDPVTPATVIASRAAFVLADGTIVDTNYTQPLSFSVPFGNYNVVIRHRNHLGIMTAAPVDFSSGAGAVNFTDGTTAAYTNTNAAQAGLGSGLFGMWGGDANGDGKVFYSNTGNDPDWILNTQLGGNYNGYLFGYFNGDVNLDAQVYYVSTENDVDWILYYPMAGNPNGFLEAQLP